MSTSRFTVRVGGLEIACASLDDVAAVVERFGASAEVGAEAVSSPPRAPASAGPLHGDCWMSPPTLGGCKNKTPILASGNVANVCHEHATQATKNNWKKIEIKHGRPTVFPIPGVTVDSLGVSVPRGYNADAYDPKRLRSKGIPRAHGRPPKSVYGPRVELPPAPFAPGALRPVELSEVAPDEVRWLWQNRMPVGMVSVLYADPGVGKGTLTATIAAVVTAGGELPDDDQRREPNSVLFLVAEDNPAKTLRPRLDAAGADVSRVRVFGPDSNVRLPQHAPDIERAARELGAALIVVDPLRGVTNGDSKSKVRETLVSLEGVASRTGAAVLVIHHTNKAGKIHGSQDILGIPRSVLRLDVDPVTGRRVVSQEKKNLAPDADSTSFRIVDRGGVGAVEWTSEEELAEEVEARAPPEEVVDDRAAADAVLAELELKADRPVLEGGIMWDERASEPALTLDDVAARLEVGVRVLRNRIRRGTAAALEAQAAVAGGQRYWTRSAVMTLIGRGFERIGNRDPGPPPGTGAKPEAEKWQPEAIDAALRETDGNVTAAAERLGVSRVHLRRRIGELPKARRREPAKRCACCERGITSNFTVCADCTKCREVGGVYESAGLCPKLLAKNVRRPDPKDVEKEMREVRERRRSEGDPSAPTVALNHRPQYGPF